MSVQFLSLFTFGVIFIFIFLVQSFLSSLYVLENNGLSEVQVVKIFSHSVGSLLTLLIVSFVEVHSYIAGGNAKRCNHYGKQHGDSSENLE